MADADFEDPFQRFAQWFEEAEAKEPNDPSAMALATVGADGMPSVRMVLLKGVDARGFVFYTNLESRKSEELAANTRAALLFHWKPQGRQIRIEGCVERVTDAEADAYYSSRPRISRLGAWASDQSRVLPERAELERRLAAYEAQYPGEDIPRPPHWSGYLLKPDVIEFWHDGTHRLHTRVVYKRGKNGWDREMLFP